MMMFCHYRLLLLAIIQVLVLLLKLGNGEIVPWHFNGTAIEFPSIPALKGVSLKVVDMYYDYHVLVTRDPEGCLPKLFLKLYHSSFYPFLFNLLYPRTSQTFTNITFFDCSSAKYLENVNLPPRQNVSVCPIFALDSNDIILDWDIIFCTKMVELFSPISALPLRANELRFQLPVGFFFGPNPTTCCWKAQNQEDI